MTIEETVYTTLIDAATDAGDRIWPNVADDSPATPYCVFQTIANAPENTLSGEVPIDSARIQVDSYAETYEGAKALAAQVRAALSALPGGYCELEQDVYESDVKRHRVCQDYSIIA